MKAKILSLLVAAMIIFNVSYANNTEGNVNETVLNSFLHQFVKAADVQWIKTPEYYKATFNWNGQFLTAFYDEKGASIAVSRNLLPNELPLLLQTNLADQYNGYWVSELFEYDTKDNNKYYITIENADKKIILESRDNSYWEVFKKSNKE